MGPKIFGVSAILIFSTVSLSADDRPYYISDTAETSKLLKKDSDDKNNDPNIQLNLQQQSNDIKTFRSPYSKDSESTESDQEEANDQLLSDIQNSIQKSFKNYNINVRIFNNTVILTGTVSSEQDKDDIEKMVGKLKGVKKITNHLQVESNQ